jgi:hypothetical protein
MKVRGHPYLEGEERGSETFSILLEIIIPITYAISFGIVYKWFSKKQQESK